MGSSRSRNGQMCAKGAIEHLWLQNERSSSWLGKYRKESGGLTRGWAGVVATLTLLSSLDFVTFIHQRGENAINSTVLAICHRVTVVLRLLLTLAVSQTSAHCRTDAAVVQNAGQSASLTNGNTLGNIEENVSILKLSISYFCNYFSQNHRCVKKAKILAYFLECDRCKIHF